MFKHPNHPSEIEDIHKGRRAIVCGSAPSLNNIDFSRVSDDNVIFACNQSVTVMSKCDYFCMTDHAVPKNSFFEYGVNITSKVATWGSFNSHEHIKNLHMQLKDKIYFFERDHSNLYDLTKRDKFIQGIDSVQCAVHLAYITGCSEIILAGVDLQHTDGEIYCDSKVYQEDVDWGGHVSEMDTLDLSFNNWKDIVSNNDATFFTANKESRLTELMPTLPIESLYC
tara:strand:+ start:467 stop:1141 length:675 start_codon:yes stop_codon:yes gene_type:complete